MVPVDNEDPVLRTHVNYERLPFAPHPPRYQPRPATPFNNTPLSVTSESSSNETAITPQEAETIPLHITNPDPFTPTDDTEDSQSETYTDTGLLPSDHLLHIAQEEA